MKNTGYVAKPTDRSITERRVEGQRVEFDRLPGSTEKNGLYGDAEINRDIVSCFRQGRYGK